MGKTEFNKKIKCIREDGSVVYLQRHIAFNEVKQRKMGFYPEESPDEEEIVVEPEEEVKDTTDEVETPDLDEVEEEEKAFGVKREMDAIYDGIKDELKVDEDIIFIGSKTQCEEFIEINTKEETETPTSEEGNDHPIKSHAVNPEWDIVEVEGTEDSFNESMESGELLFVGTAPKCTDYIIENQPKEEAPAEESPNEEEEAPKEEIDVLRDQYKEKFEKFPPKNWKPETIEAKLNA